MFYLCVEVLVERLESRMTGVTLKSIVTIKLEVQSDTDLPDPDLPEPRFTGRIIFPRNRKFAVFDPDIPGTTIYRAKPFPPRIPVNRGPTVYRDVNFDTYLRRDLPRL